MKGRNFVFDYAQLLCYKFHKINPNYGGSYVDSPDGIKNKKSTINPIDKKCMFCMLKNKNKYILPIFQKRIQILKRSYFFNDSKWRRVGLSSSKKKLAALLRGIALKNNGDFYCLKICFA